ncbi:unnamed protein product [Soboliphyme baturini]|uniref:WD_REPEATS_REGION domain-containing protein n=1 Tax=Soboliphyme baturini TaxID=241478 RepID=A0A183IUJ6_9BILA|nr:unnamed protein product [Soboliphyme baturini]
MLHFRAAKEKTREKKAVKKAEKTRTVTKQGPKQKVPKPMKMSAPRVGTLRTDRLYVMDALKDYYCTIFALTYSPCCKYLCAADRYGFVTVFSGTYEGKIKGYCWEDVISRTAKRSWCLDCNSQDKKSDVFEVNALLMHNSSFLSNQIRFSAFQRILCSAGGDSNVYFWDLEDGSLVGISKGHTDYLHCISDNGPNGVISAGEDGQIRLWGTSLCHMLCPRAVVFEIFFGLDTRTYECRSVLEPYNSDCARPQVGKWIGALASEPHWLVYTLRCPELGLWHLDSLQLAKILPASNSESHCAAIYDDKIFTGGSRGSVFIWDFNGQLSQEINVTSSCVYAMALNANSDKYRVCFLRLCLSHIRHTFTYAVPGVGFVRLRFFYRLSAELFV